MGMAETQVFCEDPVLSYESLLGSFRCLFEVLRVRIFFRDEVVSGDLPSALFKLRRAISASGDAIRSKITKA